jgi:hypothetical protein
MGVRSDTRAKFHVAPDRELSSDSVGRTLTLMRSAKDAVVGDACMPDEFTYSPDPRDIR